MISRGLALIFVGATLAAIPTVLGAKPDWTAISLTWLGLSLSVVGGILQELDARPYVRNFSPVDWQTDGERYFIDIPRPVHGKARASIAEIYTLKDTGRYAVCMCDVQRNEDGDCRVEIDGNPFTGRIVIS